MNVMFEKCDIMVWDGGFGMLEMLEINRLEERQDGVLLKREGQNQC